MGHQERVKASIFFTFKLCNNCSIYYHLFNRAVIRMILHLISFQELSLHCYLWCINQSHLHKLDFPLSQWFLESNIINLHSNYLLYFYIYELCNFKTGLHQQTWQILHIVRVYTPKLHRAACNGVCHKSSRLLFLSPVLMQPISCPPSRRGGSLLFRGTRRFILTLWGH